MRTPTVQLLLPEIEDLLQEGQYADLRRVLLELHEADVADLLEDLAPDEAAVVFRLLPRDRAAEVFAHLEPEVQEGLIDDLGAEGALRIVESMDLDDRAALLDELPAEVATRLVSSLSPENRRQTQLILGYPPESVGRLMTPDYVRIKRSWTVQRALDHIRRYGRDAETVNWVYVVDDEGRLVDDLHIRKLLLADPSATIESIFDGQILVLQATDDQEEAVRLMSRYDRTALPVVDSRGMLVGIVTHDDVSDVAEEEATEDFQKQGGVVALERPYMQTGLVEMIRKRAPWLVALFICQNLSLVTLSFFEEQLDAVVILALFVPLIISTGGNTGTQASSLVIRALALQELHPRQWHRVLRKELTTGVFLGMLMGLMAGLAATVVQLMGVGQNEAPFRVGFAISLAVIANVLWAAVLGSLLPLALQRLKLDPAAMSAPMVATLMDVTGLLIYFSVALTLLTGVLL